MPEMFDKKEATSQIVGASTNLVGICLVIITGIKLSGLSDSTVVDQITAFASVLFLVSCMFAYFSLRRASDHVGLYRDIADYSFMAGLVVFVVSIVFLAFNLIY